MEMLALEDASSSASASAGSNHSAAAAVTGKEEETCTIEENPVVNCLPTLGGGTTPKAITTFYTSEFLPSAPRPTHPPAIAHDRARSRRRRAPPLLHPHRGNPLAAARVPPTGRPVRVALVMSASFCTGKLARLNIYWDQACVLVQIGLLDPELVPAGFRVTGTTRDGKASVERLPVVGAEGVDRMVS
ncbi:hypothetical protein BO70DRAFT_358076 [Aspergillus heteromorphus CBS 117.55]|uniref:Uncharacterized protein n=1 Tax=Aspergillus heteromorphus CBS 117.55 TaxID=1448321 RepID=A0A317X3M4_9EURO|nr:uncharacterized protein BO70DRAFT_358076 [Aspergillus heteromorphus CBS 117.55]PWY92945.1 hypothetical protein BO70DRAFT_358076 [Aspergillus heteromorphus CBS 117.55]